MIATRDLSLAPDVAQDATVRFRAEVLRGLRAPLKSLPCKYFYDDAGAELFEQITRLPEYYLTRTEQAIMEQHAADMAAPLGRRCLLIEYGSGSIAKTRLLLRHLREPAAYVPIDVSAAFLKLTAQALTEDFPGLEILPICADFSRALSLPAPRKKAARRVVYFPGSTIGNFTPTETVALLRHTARLCGPGGSLLLGADLQKSPRIIEAAYNDSQGVTAAFNCNVLARINRELDADFNLEQFAHRAFYNAAEGRIEMHLISQREQQVRIGDAVIGFAEGESIRTEYSYKYSLADVRELATVSGFAVKRVWTDPREYFSVQCLAVH